MSQSNIIYEDTQVSFSCCMSPKHALPKPNLNHIIQPQNGRDRKDKKISLKKYQQTQSHMKSTEYRLSIKDTLTAGTHLKTTRLSDISETHKITNAKNLLWSGNRLASERHSLNLRADIRPFFEHYEKLYTLPAQTNLQSRILAKTTIQRIQPVSDELKKTLRGGTQFHRIKKLSSLKESVCSYSGSGQDRQRFQQSQILLDFFHPSVTRLNAIEPLIKLQEFEPHSLNKSTVIQ